MTGRPRGRPPGRTAEGERRKAELYAVAVRMFAERGYEGTTLRAIADEAGVSPALLYRYFPSKTAVVMALYEEMTGAFEATGASMPAGAWADRFGHALTSSLAVARPHRELLSAVLPVLLSDREHGLFSPAASTARQRVEGQFLTAVRGATDAPAEAEALGRLLYFGQLLVILWLVLDRSDGQHTTDRVIALAVRAAHAGKFALWLPGASAALRQADVLVREGLLGEGDGR